MFMELLGVGLIFALTVFTFNITRLFKQHDLNLVSEFLKMFTTLALYTLATDYVIQNIISITTTPFTQNHLTMIAFPTIVYIAVVTTTHNSAPNTPLKEKQLPESMQSEETTTTKPISDSVTLHNILEENK